MTHRTQTFGKNVNYTLSLTLCVLVCLLFTQCNQSYTNTSAAATIEKQADIHKLPSKITNKSYKKKAYFKAPIDRNLYATAEYDIDWPTEAGEYDLSPLQKAITEFCFDERSTDISSVLKAHVNIFPMPETGTGWERVKRAGESDYDFDGDGDYEYPMFSPRYSAMVEFVNYNSQTGLVRYDASVICDNGAGTNAGIIHGEEFIYYDLKNGKIVRFSDFFEKDSKNALKKKLKKNHVLTDGVTESDLWLDDLRVSEIFYVEKGIVYFVYGKYEIGAGCFDNIRLGLRISDIEDYITPYARELFDL